MCVCVGGGILLEMTALLCCNYLLAPMDLSLSSFGPVMGGGWRVWEVCGWWGPHYPACISFDEKCNIYEMFVSIFCQDGFAGASS